MKKLLLLCTALFLTALLPACRLAPEKAPFGGSGGKPQRIISASLDSDEILLALVPPERIVALSSLADTAVSYTQKEAAPVKGRILQHTVEEILSYDPDLVILSGWEGEDFRKTLTDMGIRVCSYQSAESLADIPGVIETIAKAAGEEEKGQALSEDFTRRVDAISRKAAANGLSRSIYLWGFSHPYGAGNTLFGDMCRRLAIRNTLEGLTDKELSSANMEFLLRTDPDRILLSDFDMSSKRVAALSRTFTGDPSLQGISAVKNDALIPLPPRVLYCPSQYAARAMEELYQAVYDETLDGAPFDPKTAYITEARNTGRGH